MQGGKEQALRRIRHTPQGNANAANAAGGILMVDQGKEVPKTSRIWYWGRSIFSISTGWDDE